MSLSPYKLGLSAGILWGLALAIMTVAGILFGYGLPFLHLMASVYPGYAVSYPGALIGLIYGFVDGFVGLYIFGWLYNRL